MFILEFDYFIFSRYGVEFFNKKKKKFFLMECHLRNVVTNSREILNFNSLIKRFV